VTVRLVVCDPGHVSWLALSLVLSVVLTVVLNVALRLFPGAGQRLLRAFARLTWPHRYGTDGTDGRVRVVVPWKTMIVASVLLTVAINLILWLR
jgi:hypothetical protein